MDMKNSGISGEWSLSRWPVVKCLGVAWPQPWHPSLTDRDR